jgi:hypothetical protein
VSAPVARHRLLGRATRTGAWADQAVSTHRLVADAVTDGRDQDAAELARYTLVEMAEVFELFPGFFDSARQFLVREGVLPAELQGEEEQLERRSPAVAALPGLAESWRAYEAAVGNFAYACDTGHGAGAMPAFEAALSHWRLAHDLACNRVYLFADVCGRRLGEERVEEFWDELMAGFYPSRDRFDIERASWEDSVEILALDTAETFRGHLSGPGRVGDIEIVEDSGRIVFSFSPCGSGGRAFVDDGTGAGVPMDDPDRFGVTTRPHDWSWGKAGVCLYCVHCCQLQERIPIRRFGYPLRVVDPPVWPEGRGKGRCTWTIYKDLSEIPAEAYERVGEHKPAELGSIAKQRGAGSL